MANTITPLPPSADEVAAGLDLSRPVTPGDLPPSAFRDQLASDAEANRILTAPRRAQNTFLSLNADIMRGTMTEWLYENAVAPEFKADPNFNFDRFQARLKNAAETGIPEEWLRTLGGALSDEHFTHLERRAREQLEAQQRIAEWGATGIGINLLANMLDPASLAVFVATGSPWLHLGRAGETARAAWVARNAAAGVSGSLAYEGARWASNQAVTQHDVLMATGLGLTLGAGFGQLTRIPNGAPIRDRIIRAGEQLQQMARETVAPPAPARPTQAAVRRAEEATPAPSAVPHADEPATLAQPPPRTRERRLAEQLAQEHNERVRAAEAARVAPQEDDALVQARRQAQENNEVVQLEDTPQLLNNPAYVGRYMSPDGHEYRIFGDATHGHAGPFRLARDGKVIARDLVSLNEARAAIPRLEREVADLKAKAALAEARQMPPARGEPGTTYEFRGYTIRRADDVNNPNEGLLKAYDKNGNEVGLVELERHPDGRWETSMVELKDPFIGTPAGSTALYGLLSAARREMGGQPIIPGGKLSKFSFPMWAEKLPWVRDWYRPQPETPGSGWMLSPRQLLANRDLIRDFNIPGAGTPKARKHWEDMLKKYDEALASLPPEALLPENRAAMFALSDRRNPMHGISIRPNAVQAVNEVLDRILPKGVKRRVSDDILPDGSLDGAYANRTVFVAMNADDPVKVAFHETTHALRELGLITPDEWTQLVAWANRTKARERYEIDVRYRDRAREQSGGDEALAQRLLDEETVAHALADHMTGHRVGGFAERVFERLTNTFRSIRAALGIKGLRTVHDVFDDFGAGRLAQRGDASAARNEVVTHDFLDDALWKSVSDAETARSARPLWLPRWDRAGIVGNNDNAAGRLVGSVLMNDSVGKVGHAVNPFSADQDQARLFNVLMGEYARARVPAFDAWADSLKLSRVERVTRAHEFAEQVGRYVGDRGSRFQGPVHPEVEKFGNHVRSILNDMRKSWQNPMRNPFNTDEAVQLKGPSVKGAEFLEENETYLWRKLDHENVRQAVDMFGESGVTRMVRGAIKSAQPDIPDNLLHRLAAGYVRSIHKRAAGVGDEWSIALGEGDRARLAKLLREDAILSDAEVEHVLQRLYPSKKVEGDSTNLKRRVLLDESYVERNLPVAEKHGFDPRDLAFRDLLDNNVDRLIEAYTRRESGRLALARVRVRLPERPGTRTQESVDANGNTIVEIVPDPTNVTGGEVLINGITDNEQWAGILQRVREWGADNGVPIRDTEAQIEHLQFAYDRIRAAPDPRQMTDTAWWLRQLRRFMAMRLMGGVGVAQMGETGTAVAQLGLRAVFSHVPAFRRVIDATGKSNLRSPIFAEIEGIGIGPERLHGLQLNSHLTDVGELPFQTSRANPRLDRLDDTTKMGEKAIYELSGMSVIQQQQERAVAAAMAEKLSKMGLKIQQGKSLSRSDVKRMAQLGMDEPMVQRVLDQLGKHADTTGGVQFSGRLSRLNMNSWNDLEARAAFENALYRQTRKLIQNNDIGSAALWMSNPLFQTFFQFRGFTFTAWANQFLYGLHMADLRTLNTFVWSVAWNAVVRAAQVQALSLGRSDQAEYLEKNMSEVELAKAGFQRAGWSSIIPMLGDTAMTFAGQQPQFNARSSGQPSDIWFGSPAISFYSTATKGIGGLADSVIDGRSPSQAAIRNFAGIMPFQNLIPVTVGLSHMISDLPQREPRERRQ